MTAHRRTVALALAGTAAIAVPGIPAGAQIVSIPAITVAAGGAYSTSPFLQADGSGDGAASTQLDIRPSVTLLDGTDTVVLSANYNRADYFSRFGSNSGYGVAASGNKRLNPRASIGVTAAFDSQILGANTGFITPATVVPTTPSTLPGTGTAGADAGQAPGGVAPLPTLPTTPIVTPIDPTGVDGDVGLIGARQRRNQVSAGLNGSYVISARSNINAAVTVSRSTYPGNRDASAFLSDFENYGANLGFSRQLDEVSSAGLQVAASYAKFGSGNDTQIYTPRLTYTRTLSERWNLAVGIGAGISKTGSGFVGGVARRDDVTQTTVSGDASLCRSGERINGCLTAARQPSITGLGGARVQNQVGLNFSYRFNSNMSAGLAGLYSRIEGSGIDTDPEVLRRAQDVASIDLSLQRRLDRRLSAVGSVSYRRSNGFVANTAEDVTGRIGLSLAIGRFQ